MIELEQELASIMKFILDNTGNPSPYYWKVPERFDVPAIYFPSPEITTGGETLLTYRMDYIWYILLFHKTSNKAYSLGLQALTAIKRKRNRIPVIDIVGKETKEAIRLKDPKLKVLDSGVAQLQLEWTVRDPYDKISSEKMQTYHIEKWENAEFYESKMIPKELEEELSPYLKE